jgi:hypothetical protein
MANPEDEFNELFVQLLKVALLHCFVLIRRLDQLFHRVEAWRPEVR